MVKLTHVLNKTCDTVVEAGLSAGFGYLFARAFMKINPVNGAVFGAVFSLVSSATAPIFQTIFQGKEAAGSTKFVGEVFHMATSLAASHYISAALGFPSTLGASATLACGPGVVLASAALLGFALCGVLLARKYIKEKVIGA